MITGESQDLQCRKHTIFFSSRVVTLMNQNQGNVM